MKKKIVVLANNDVGLYNFRKELLERLIKEGWEVCILLPNGDKIVELQKLGCVFYELPIDRRGTNPIRDFGLFLRIRKLLKRIKPEMVLTYTIKPNIYGGMAARFLHIPYVANITGLGTAVEYSGILQLITVQMYRIALKKAKCVFCQNKGNMEFIVNHRMVKGRLKLLPGSGVNLQRFALQEYPEDGAINFVFISRIMKEKGINEYLGAAAEIKMKYPNVQFHICGFCEEEFEDRLNKMQEEGIVEYHGMVQDVRVILKDMHCAVLPSYHEGMSNVLLEAAATGRPLIASNIPGCRECIEDGTSGFLVEVGNTVDLIEKIETFVNRPYNQKKEMGMEARKKVEQLFDRQQIVDAYMEEI